MIERQHPDYRQLSARGSGMSNIADGDVSTFKSVGEAHGRLGGAFDIPAEDQSAPEHLASAAQRLAALGQMTGGIAHDFRNILAIIKSGLTLAEKNSEQPDGARIYIAAAREAVNRGLKLTSQLLSFAKQQELEAHAGNANDFLRNLEVFLKYGAGPGIASCPNSRRIFPCALLILRSSMLRSSTWSSTRGMQCPMAATFGSALCDARQSPQLMAP